MFKKVKKFFHESLDSIFEQKIAVQSRYKVRKISLTLQNALCNGEYIETYVRNYVSLKVLFGDTIYRRLHESTKFEIIDSMIEHSVEIGKKS